MFTYFIFASYYPPTFVEQILLLFDIDMILRLCPSRTSVYTQFILI